MARDPFRFFVLFGLRILFLVMVFLPASSSRPASADQSAKIPDAASIPGVAHQEYLDFFEKVYDTMDKNYYYPVSRQSFERFLVVFDQKIFSQLKDSGKSFDYIRWRSAAHLVDALKNPEDIFSMFMPPKFAEKFEQEALGQRIDLGIEGELTETGYRVNKVEIRSDAFEKGLREGDTLVKIDEEDVRNLSSEGITERLNPLEGSLVRLEYFSTDPGELRAIAVESKEYFKEDVYFVPVDVPGVYCLQIKRFNRMTAPDMERLLRGIMAEENTSLIIDLRGNPGGPPLAAREIASFFLTPEEEFSYFKWKNRPVAALDVPRIPEAYRYRGDIAILVDQGSGSASELFSGIMQWRKRATVIGTNTAGQVFLKSMFHFDDESMVLLVTARGHRPDGEVFSFQGVTPNIPSPQGQDDLIRFAADYLAEKKRESRPEENP